MSGEVPRVYDEWRVTADHRDPWWREWMPAYDFTFSERINPDVCQPDAETAAKRFVEQEGFARSMVNVRLWRRTVTISEWEEKAVDDLASRLRAQLDEREQRHREVLTALELAVDHGAAVGSKEYIRAAAEELLKVCRAHQDVLAMYVEAQASRGARGPLFMRDLEHASSMARLTTLGLVVEALVSSQPDLVQNVDELGP